ncbi:pyridoxal phosphate-dependent transferase [Limtongia smithiae]|uniref:pyridoxal phosphate-dependent transferase n=1 Tax=Limtongia smithiae TaxID=1125753 RepID=UPI0034CD7934
MLSRQVNPDDLVNKEIRRIRASIATARQHSSHSLRASTPYISRYTAVDPVPKYSLPSTGLDAKATYQLIRDDLDLDGRPNLNLASFVGTYIESESLQLSIENITKNLADSDEYPALIDIHSRCISILAHLWHASPDEKPIGSATTGSSEAIHLAGLAMKRRWVERRRAEGKDTSNPNIIMGANAQVALEKFARYFDVEARLIPVSDVSFHCLDPALVLDHVDENTIGIFVILGSTYTGHYEPVQQVSDLLDDLQVRTGIDVPIHVDAASGGFVAPFCHPHTVWDFRLPRVKSINTSGHKYGLVTAGLGWIIYRSEDYLPKHLIFELKYLGGVEQTFTLNFSRPGFTVIQQYFNFLHLGREGYTAIQQDSLANARLLSKTLEASGYFLCLSEIHRKKGIRTFIPGDEFISVDSEDYNAGLPVVSFRLADSFKETYPHVKQAAISTLLRVKGFIVPNYELPPNEATVEILRIVVRESMTEDLLQRLVEHIVLITESLMQADDIDMSALTSPLQQIPSIARRISSLGAVSADTSQSDLSLTPKLVHKHGHYKGVC